MLYMDIVLLCIMLYYILYYDITGIISYSDSMYYIIIYGYDVHQILYYTLTLSYCYVSYYTMYCTVMLQVSYHTVTVYIILLYMDRMNEYHVYICVYIYWVLCHTVSIYIMFSYMDILYTTLYNFTITNAGL